MTSGTKIRVPATVANLGPGFDALGVAVRMYLDIDIEPRRGSVDIAVEGEGAGELPADGTNLVVRAMDAYFDTIGRRPSGYALRINNRIPIAAGLGSSAAAVVGGLVAAGALTGRSLPQGDLIELATRIEGHPDNVMPALLGGFVVCYREAEGAALRYFRLLASDRLVPILAVPRGGYPTASARRSLPSKVSFSDAQFSASRAALLVACIAGGAGLDVLAEAMVDRLHEPARLGLMPESAQVEGALRTAGLPVALAGAGPSLVIVVPRPEAATRAEQVRRVCRARSTPWRVFVGEWEPNGALPA